MHILSPRWLVPGLRYQWNGVENLRHFAKILSKFSRDCDNFQAPFYTRTSLNYIKICFSPSNCGNVSFKIMHIVVKIWDWANSILQFKIKLERLWNKRALEFVSKQRLSFSVDSQFSQSGCAITFIWWEIIMAALLPMVVDSSRIHLVVLSLSFTIAIIITFFFFSFFHLLKIEVV